MASAQEFYLQELNIEVDAAKALLHGGDNTTPFTDVSANALLKIPVSYARHLFQYQADAIDVNDLNKDDIKFRMFHKTTNDLSTDISGDTLKLFNSKNVIPGESEVILNSIGFYGSANVNPNEMKVNSDFVRHIAEKIFGVPVTDLFSNERVVRNDINKDSADVYVSKIQELVDFRVNYIDASNQYVRVNTVQGNVTDSAEVVSKATQFPARLIFSQLVNSAPERFASLDTIIDPSNVDGLNASLDSSNNLLHLFDPSDNIFDPSENQTNQLWRYMPLKVGDSIYFKLTISPDETQENETTANNQSGTDISSRSYRIKMLLVSDEDDRVASSQNTESMTDFWRPWDNLGWDSTVPLYHLNDTQNPDQTTDDVNI